MSSTPPFFTVFIPTFNRAHLLPRAFQSIEAQTFRDFEVLIVDDGSTDNTGDLVQQWAQTVPFSVRCIQQTNQGKYAAHNAGVHFALGQLFFLLDSDDRLLPNTLERIHAHWMAIPAADRDRYAGVEGLVESMDGQRLLTDPYPQSPLDTHFLDTQYRLHIGGDKKHAIVTEILRHYPYPIFPGERHVRDSITWKRWSHRYILRCVNESFQQVEYQPDGLTANRFAARMSSPRGFQLFYREDITLHRAWLSRRQLRRSTIDFIRFSLHCGEGFVAQGRQVGFNPLWMALFPAGVVRWSIDHYRLRFKGGQHPNKIKIKN